MASPLIHHDATPVFTSLDSSPLPLSDTLYLHLPSTLQRACSLLVLHILLTSTMPSPRVTAIFLSPRAKAPSPQTYTHTLSTQPLRPRPNQHQNHHQQTSCLSKPQIHNFTTSNPRQAREPNFYEILDVPISSTPAEIKKYRTSPKSPSKPNHQPKSETLTPKPTQTILRPLPPPPSRPQQIRPRRQPTLRPNLSRLQCPKQRSKTRNLRPRPRPARTTILQPLFLLLAGPYTRPPNGQP